MFSQIANDLKAHLEQGGQLAVSHVAPLLDLAAKVEADPLAQAAVSIVVPPACRETLAQFLRTYEADIRAVADAAAAAAQQPPADPAAPPA